MMNSQVPPLASADDGMSFWFRWLIKTVAVVLGVLATILGILTAISIGFWCIVSGLVLMAAGILVLVFEVPVCFSFIEFLQPFSRFSEGRPPWQKVAMYIIPPVIVIALCQGFTAILGSLCIFGVAALYFMVTVGKKAPIDEMRNRAVGESKSNLTDQA